MSSAANNAGRVWKFGDNIDTDVLAPGLYMKSPLAELARHCLESVEPRFAKEVKPGDIVVGGRNFGMGSSREQAVMALRELGVAAVVAPSFAGIFYRNALNLGLLALVCPEAAQIRTDAVLAVDATAATLRDLETGKIYVCETLPAHLLQMIADGGLLPHLEKKLNAQRSKEAQA
ncbi:MAG: 3-isopropylmalate dehydratase [Ferrovibrio sp.]|uniref:LeuD/DmdB family oxidoreductase small subunit n=1 Tax=Ferrovibrio sp. TaxID=1917215 RepID=UPI00261300DE|nr:3-isopropylmalate dehydratase [Ferrovibrio sp.]MCW0235061.1 3-isopropylmalate dehydratase [Ferrovibrio sp.]